MFAQERRRYPRLNRPIFYRKTPFWKRWKMVADISLGGCRVYSPTGFSPGQEIELDIVLRDGTTLRARARVVWTAEMPENQENPFEMGLEFMEIPAEARGRLREYLVDENEEEDEGAAAPPA